MGDTPTVLKVIAIIWGLLLLVIINYRRVFPSLVLRVKLYLIRRNIEWFDGRTGFPGMIVGNTRKGDESHQDFHKFAFDYIIPGIICLFMYQEDFGSAKYALDMYSSTYSIKSHRPWLDVINEALNSCFEHDQMTKLFLRQASEIKIEQYVGMSFLQKCLVQAILFDNSLGYTYLVVEKAVRPPEWMLETMRAKAEQHSYARNFLNFYDKVLLNERMTSNLPFQAMPISKQAGLTQSGKRKI
ncbi:hypothetical protein [Burkholderia cenocepacia]|uniref:hypothetical protein n=1 Tax=Burkholderia cenocepacia TaxID=95486 RepID=UPI00222E535E|nr:hypothetical protein [Burkholderia cenocepacia]MCW3498712.1 hypothetical protein [Burkholderia cenocepacia]MCW3506200.1 hypothetical protein [Burkholderia cenocepacia]MCW3513865.1 hypothetical protein [Burkholderia cenocepacia]MCW3529015.1 hypothetical protein [Burkholderia cenocepacia]MCW3544651.1 hypothetical protein [Burkholderia cenocepacia]